MLAEFPTVCANAACEIPEIDPGDIVELVGGRLVHQGCTPTVKDTSERIEEEA